MSDSKSAEERDYCGYDVFMAFHDKTIRLPDDLICEIEQLAEEHPKYGIDGMYALLLRAGIKAIRKDPSLFGNE